MTDRSAEELERDAERIRSGIAQTTDELKARMSPGQMVDEVANYFRDSDGAIALDRFRNQVRENPMALALIGTGIAWLMWGGSGRRSAGRYDYDEDYDDDYDSRRLGDPAYRSGGLYEPAPGSAYGASEPLGGGTGSTEFGGMGSTTGTTTPGSSYPGSSYGGTTPSGAAGVGSYSSTPETTGGTTSGSTGSSLREKAGDLAEKAGEVAERAGDFVTGAAERMRRASHDARDRARGLGEGAMARGRSVAGSSRYYARSGKDSLLDALEREPLITGAIGLAVGAAIGAMLPNTRYEDEYLGDARDRLARGAGDALERAKERASHVAEEAYAAARATAEQEGLLPSGDRPVAEKLGNVARAAADTAAREASGEANREGYGSGTAGSGTTGIGTTGGGAAGGGTTGGSATGSGLRADVPSGTGGLGGVGTTGSGTSGIGSSTGTSTTTTGSGLSGGGSSGVGAGTTPGAAGDMSDRPRTGTDDLNSRGSDSKRDVGPGGTGPA